MKQEIKANKEEMAKVYSEKAREYGVVRNEKFDEFLEEEIVHFVDSVKKVGTRVVDLGSGPGNESLRLKELGLEPVCIDNAQGMIAECREKGLEALVMDFYKLGLAEQSFAGAWMAFSFLHVPKKNASMVLKEIERVLISNGIFYISLFEGEGEGFLRDEDIKRFGIKRFFSYYKSDELKKMLLPYFEITKMGRSDLQPRPTISFECQKRN